MISEVHEPLALNCWKVQKEGKTHYVTLFDNEGAMYKYVTIGGCHFSEKRFYLVTYKYLKEKAFASGKPYKSLYGVYILSKISYEQYKSGEWALPERAIGEQIKWVQGGSILCGEITAIEHDEDSGEYLYHVLSKHPYVEDIITEQDIFEEEEASIEQQAV